MLLLPAHSSVTEASAKIQAVLFLLFFFNSYIGVLGLRLDV